MSRKLIILPYDGENFSQTVIPVEECSYIYSEIDQISQMEVEDGFNSYFPEDTGEDGYGETKECGYGLPLKFCYAKDLARCLDDSPAKEYVKALPPKNKIALYWR